MKYIAMPNLMVLLFVLLCSAPANAGNTTLGITIGPASPPTNQITLTPASPVTVMCTAAAGSVVTHVTTSITPATLTLLASPPPLVGNIVDFVFANGTTTSPAPADIVIKKGGITPANCGKTFDNDVNSNP